MRIIANSIAVPTLGVSTSANGIGIEPLCVRCKKTIGPRTQTLSMITDPSSKGERPFRMRSIAYRIGMIPLSM
jgi:hypothetical protein